MPYALENIVADLYSVLLGMENRQPPPASGRAAWRVKALQRSNQTTTPSPSISRSSSERDYDLQQERRRKLRGDMVAPSMPSSASLSEAGTSLKDESLGKGEILVKPVTPVADLNKLSAKLVKAEMMGNAEEAKKLRTAIKSAKNAKVEIAPVALLIKHCF